MRAGAEDKESIKVAVTVRIIRSVFEKYNNYSANIGKQSALVLNSNRIAQMATDKRSWTHKFTHCTRSRRRKRKNGW